MSQEDHLEVLLDFQGSRDRGASRLEAGSLAEGLQRRDAGGLWSPGSADVRAIHLSIHHDFPSNAILSPEQYLVSHGHRNSQQLAQTFVEAQAGRHIFREVSVLQVGDVHAPLYLLAWVGQPSVAWVCVHAALEGGVICHLATIAVQVPLMQGACVLQVQPRYDFLHLRLDSLHLVCKFSKHALGELVHTLVKQRLFRERLAVPLLRAPSAVHHPRVDLGSGVSKADAQVVGALHDVGKHAKAALKDGEGRVELRWRSHSSKDAAFGSKACCLPTPFGETAGPRKSLETHENHVLCLVAQLGCEKDVTS
mmetsp:Transcript_80268/g.167081  ORF Transcript_80268/g.167081 Transcript_80268/m.167081 type:complete len:309 (+) Transcript_80268:1185-2111(+)